MNYPAASSGVSSKAMNAPKGGEYNPSQIKSDKLLILLYHTEGKRILSVVMMTMSERVTGWILMLS